MLHGTSANLSFSHDTNFSYALSPYLLPDTSSQPWCVALAPLAPGAILEPHFGAGEEELSDGKLASLSHPAPFLNYVF